MQHIQVSRRRAISRIVTVIKDEQTEQVTSDAAEASSPSGREWLSPLVRAKVARFRWRGFLSRTDLADIRADLTTHIELRLKTFKGSGGASPATYFDRVATRWLISERRRRFAAKRDPRREECSLDEPVPDRSGAVVTRHELIEEASADPQEVHDLRRDLETLRERLPTDHHRQFLDAKARGGTTNSIAHELGLSRPRVAEIEIEVRVVARIIGLDGYLTR